MNKPLSAHEALIYVMVLASAVDRTMNDRELSRIYRSGEIASVAFSLCALANAFPDLSTISVGSYP